MKQRVKTARPARGLATGRTSTAVRRDPSRNHPRRVALPAAAAHAQVWAYMDQLAERATALWPAGVSAAEAVSRARRSA